MNLHSIELINISWPCLGRGIRGSCDRSIRFNLNVVLGKSSLFYSKLTVLVFTVAHYGEVISLNHVNKFLRLIITFLGVYGPWKATEYFWKGPDPQSGGRRPFLNQCHPRRNHNSFKYPQLPDHLSILSKNPWYFQHPRPWTVTIHPVECRTIRSRWKIHIRGVRWTSRTPNTGTRLCETSFMKNWVWSVSTNKPALFYPLSFQQIPRWVAVHPT